jgi:lipid-binding SYLF domain-containing protein
MTSIRQAPIATAVLLLALAGCATAPRSHADRDELKGDAAEALKKMEGEDTGLTGFLQGAAGYVVFPHVGKGGYFVGGSYGRGVVYEGGAPVGYADITQATIGLQFGGAAVMELLSFESPGDLRRFKSGKLAFSANLGAVILKTGAAQSARYTDGVAVFVKPIGGAMVEAAVGGQQFTYQPE